MTPSPTNISKRFFGRHPNGETVEAWTLTGRGGLELEVLSYGAIVRRIEVPNEADEKTDVVLGYDTLENYLNDPFYMGATVGRIAGRVSGGKLRIADTDFQLPTNEGVNHLHGGPDSFHSKIWTAKPLSEGDEAPRISLKYHSPHLENGYPGNLDCEVIISITDENEFVYETVLQSDQHTPASLTHHSYFNLRGHGEGNILEHLAEISSSQAFRSDEAMALQDELIDISQTPAHLGGRTKLGDVIPFLWQKHGDLYWLGASDTLKHAATVEDPESGRRLEVHTTLPCLQTYFGAALETNFPAKEGARYEPFGGFCLECEGYPQATQADGFGDIMVQPDQPQHHITTYKFTTLP